VKFLLFILLLVAILYVLMLPSTQAFLDSSPGAIVPYGHPSQSSHTTDEMNHKKED